MALELLSRRLATTIANYIYGAVDAMSRRRKVLSVLKKLGKITYGHGGDPSAAWDVEYRQAELLPYSGSFTFAAVDRWKQAQLPWGGYAATDMISERERLVNSGKQALVKVYDKMGTRIKNDITQQFPSRILRSDGNASGHELEISGFETCFGISGQAVAADCPVGVNNDVYAGLSTAPNAYGGAWEDDGAGNEIWPLGIGPTVSDFWRPLVVLWDSTKFSGATQTWKANAEEAIRFGIHHSRRNDTMDGDLSMVLLWRDGFRQFKDVQQLKQRINVMANSPLYEVGFRDMFNYDGIDVTDDYDVPNEIGYGVPGGVLELMCLTDDLFRVRDDMDLASDSHRFVADMHGQLKIESLRHMVKWQPIP